MPVHELEPSAADVPHEGVGYSGKKWMGRVCCVRPSDHILIMVAGDIHSVHVGEAVQESLAPGDNAVERVPEQFEKVPDDDQLPFPVLDVLEEGIQK